MNHQNTWTPALRITFRLFFAYYLLYCFPFPFSYIPFLQQLGIWGNQLMHWYLDLFSENILHQTLDWSPNGSGDTTTDYLQWIIMLLTAIGITVIWSISDRKRKAYPKLFSYLHVYLRFYLAFVLFGYGIIKLFILQFSELSLLDLLKPYGESTPMALAWNFMEYSDTYTFFSGLMETLAGLLLIFRRTTALGSLMTFGVMLNVFMMNMSYDIPVKLFSSHLMLMALFILIPYYKNLLNLFILNKPSTPVEYSRYFNKKWLNITGWTLKTILVLYTVTEIIQSSVKSRHTYGKEAVKPALYGIYEVNSFQKNNQEIPPLLTDTIRWNKLVIDKFNGNVIGMNNTRKPYRTIVDTTNLRLSLASYSTQDTLNFNYVLSDSILKLYSEFNDDTLNIELRLIDHTQFPLLREKFKWINEFPNNR